MTRTPGNEEAVEVNRRSDSPTNGFIAIRCLEDTRSRLNLHSVQLLKPENYPFWGTFAIWFLQQNTCVLRDYLIGPNLLPSSLDSRTDLTLQRPDRTFLRNTFLHRYACGCCMSTPSTDHSSIRPPHRKKRKRKANCFIGRHPGTGSTFIRDPCVFSNHTKAPGRWTFGIAVPITCATLDAPPPSTPPFGVVPRTRKLDCSGIEPGSLYRRESRFNLSSDDNRVRV
ncbi:uncharacterized protein TNCV_4090571 [Trichonephila clavipes]|uniref:Uncharacterized protein n=1 Tax=Trichonephila clavipes TaxID=2585209 RepID=A0A8X6S922_TRICX|nr:uncharacterized protein TNCV_4090571 [Trichonephila clavipes]